MAGFTHEPVGDDPEHIAVVPGGLLAPTAKAGLAAAIAGDEIEDDFASSVAN